MEDIRARPAGEDAHSRAIRSCGLVRGQTDPALDDITAVAATALGVPLAMVSMLDGEDQWFASWVGPDAERIAVGGSFCSWAVPTPDEAFVVPDMRTDPRFSGADPVVGAPFLRFHAGMPIRDAAGLALGTLCVLDTVPRAGLTAVESDVLVRLARRVERHLHLSARASDLEAAHDRAVALTEHAADAVLVVDGDGVIGLANAAAFALTGAGDLVGRTLEGLVHRDDAAAVARLLSCRSADRVDLRVRRVDSVGHRIVECLVSDRRRDRRVGGVIVHLRDVTEQRHATGLVRHREAQLRAAERLAGMGSYRYDILSGALEWTDGMYALLGYEVGVIEPSLAAWAAAVHPDEQAATAVNLDALRVGVEVTVDRRRIVRRDGTERIVMVQTDVEVVDGVPVAAVGTIRDITDLVAGEQALQAERTFLTAVLDNLAEGVVACDARGMLTLFNRAAQGFHGRSVESLPPAEWGPYFDLYEADGVTPLAIERIPLRRALHGEVVRNQDMTISPVAGSAVTVSCNAQAIRDASGATVGAVGTMHDVTAHRQVEVALRYLADHDQLTGLWNRGALGRRLGDALAGDGAARVVLLFVDLDRFKEINDVHGHRAGDEVLMAVAGRLLAAVKDTDTVARFGGDEFVVLCEDTDPEDAPGIAARLQEIGGPVRVDVALVSPRGSVGWSCAADDPGATAESLLQAADRDMYRHKQR